MRGWAHFAREGDHRPQVDPDHGWIMAATWWLMLGGMGVISVVSTVLAVMSVFQP